MPIVNRFADLHADVTEWRRDLHCHPELQYNVFRTAKHIADKLTAFDVDEVTTGVGRTGVVGVIRGRESGSGKVIALRADMDALPIVEATGKEYASRNPGLMHACGHDGHTAMLLGATKYLAETRNFDGTAIVIFQPAEEGGAGAKAMLDDGLLQRWRIQEVYGMHNIPGIPVGTFAIRPGAIMAATDRVGIEIEGRGGHGAWPQDCVDPIVVGSHIVTGVQSIVSRNVDPRKSAVISLTVFQAGETDNVIAQTAHLKGTVRTLDAGTRDLVETRLNNLVETTAKAFGATATLAYRRDYPVTSNHPEQTDVAAAAADRVVGTDRVNRAVEPKLGGEDFAFMLEACPGAYIYMGNGDSAQLHHPEYDFNDEAIPYGCSYWVSLIETTMPVR